MKTGSKADIGRKGEDIICEYLAANGHAILERNWRAGHLEVDIITLACDGIHFVEVKTRVAPVTADPEENVRTAKRRRMARAAGLFLAQREAEFTSGLEAWLDVATVVLGEGKAQVEYYPNAYTPIYFG